MIAKTNAKKMGMKVSRGIAHSKSRESGLFFRIKASPMLLGRFMVQQKSVHVHA